MRICNSESKLPETWVTGIAPYVFIGVSLLCWTLDSQVCPTWLSFCLPSFFSEVFFWYDFVWSLLRQTFKECSRHPLHCCTSLFTPSSMFMEYCRVRKIQVGKEFWAVLDSASEVALQLVYSPANTAQDEAGLCSKDALLAHVQLIHQVGALCPSVSPGNGNKIHALFTLFAWNSVVN